MYRYDRMSLKLLSVNGEIGDANFTVLHIPPKMFVDLLKQNVGCKSHKLQNTYN